MDKKTLHRIGIFIYNDAEVLDFSGPFEVFCTAKRLIDNKLLPMEVLLIAESTETVVARGSFHVTPHFSIHDHPPLTTLIVAGGLHAEVMHNRKVQGWLQQQSKIVENCASVCTGAFLLAAAGIVDKHTVTTHWEDLQDLQQQYPQLQVLEGKRWVEAQTDRPRIVTSGGISAGIDMSLYLLSLIADSALAIKTATQMEFDWRTND